MAHITYETPDGVGKETVDADDISDSGKVDGIRLKREDGSYLHLPDGRLYSIRMSEEEGKVDYSSP
jgi:hypothetical protein